MRNELVCHAPCGISSSTYQSKYSLSDNCTGPSATGVRYIQSAVQCYVHSHTLTQSSTWCSSGFMASTAYLSEPPLVDGVYRVSTLDGQSLGIDLSTGSQRVPILTGTDPSLVRMSTLVVVSHC